MGVHGGGYGSHDIVARLAGGSRLRRRVLRMIYPPMPTLNIIPRAVLAGIRDALFRPGVTVINVGSGALSGCGRRLWQGVDTSKCCVVHMDILAGPPVALVADAHRLPFPDETVDSVILQALLEHVEDPRQVIAEAERVLRPGGHLYIEMPFLQGLHADPDDFQRYTLEGLRHRLKRFDEIYSGVSVGPFCTLVWVLRDGVSSCFKNLVLYAGSRFLAGWLLSPLRYLDYVAQGSQVANRLANEYYFLCRKPAKP